LLGCVVCCLAILRCCKAGLASRRAVLQGGAGKCFGPLPECAGACLGKQKHIPALSTRRKGGSEKVDGDSSRRPKDFVIPSPKIYGSPVDFHDHTIVLSPATFLGPHRSPSRYGGDLFSLTELWAASGFCMMVRVEVLTCAMCLLLWRCAENSLETVFSMDATKPSNSDKRARPRPRC
jgi:hypothetical protein